ncbi:hypothetical protein GCK72_017764 [Caenorhabditis remanei]|uniref:Uncharacterized protein n=1 Tax=Caenorhabditis remanei TaxID=31234 RepID=A0A6A5G845_CAERE|nr:hypothetical protein GCK72_017764 [Caenorhabditis remanei]KAF1751210.1 hypothetical protein GCK72_017764 [Caenorhabditis remanei]
MMVEKMTLLRMESMNAPQLHQSGIRNDDREKKHSVTYELTDLTVIMQIIDKCNGILINISDFNTNFRSVCCSWNREIQRIGDALEDLTSGEICSGFGNAITYFYIKSVRPETGKTDLVV